MIRREGGLQPCKERNVQRLIALRQILEVDVDALKAVHQDPSPQFQDDLRLNIRVVEEDVDALRVEVAHLRVAEHRHDVEIVLARNLHHVGVVRDHRRIPVVEIEARRLGLQVHP